MGVLEEIFGLYSAYTGESILMVLFYVSLIYVAVEGKSRGTKTVILYGSAILTIVVFCPLTYLVYTKFVDVGTYWRMFWVIPVGIGLAFAGTKLINEHRVSGFILALFILLLGGRVVYSIKSSFDVASNAYQLKPEVIDIADYLESKDINGYKVAVDPSLLEEIRQYDVNIKMPYGREQYDPSWGQKSGFFEAMKADSLDYEVLSKKCLYNTTRFIVVDGTKNNANAPEDSGFEFRVEYGDYRIYEYMGL